MPYRFVKITNYYRPFLKGYYNSNPEVKTKSYNEQLSHLMSQLFGWSDYFINHLNSVNVEAYEIIANAIPLQNSWAQQNNSTSKGFELLFEQLKTLKPNVIFFQDSLFIAPSFLNKIREKIPSVKLIVGWCCSPFTQEHLNNYKLFDLIFVCSPEFYDEIKKYNKNVFQIYHAFEDSLLQKINIWNIDKNIDFIFTGSLIPGKGFHKDRIDLIKNLFDNKIDVKMFVSNQLDTIPQFLMKSSGFILSKTLNTFGLNNVVNKITPLRKISNSSGFPQFIPLSNKIKNNFNPPIFGKEMYEVLSKSKICFNSHGEVAGNYACNIRLFETTGVGSLLLTDYKNNINDLFDIDNEVVTYKNVDECVEKVKYLLNHQSEIERISKNGQLRTLKSHQLKDRVFQIHEIILEELNSL